MKSLNSVKIMYSRMQSYRYLAVMLDLDGLLQMFKTQKKCSQCCFRSNSLSDKIPCRDVRVWYVAANPFLGYQSVVVQSQKPPLEMSVSRSQSVPYFSEFWRECECLPNRWRRSSSSFCSFSLRRSSADQSTCWSQM